MMFLHHPLRVPAPMIKRSAQWKAASWAEACAVIAERITAICHEHGPEAVGGLISPRATNEEVYLFQRFMREVVGTNNIDSTGRLALQPYLLAVQDILGRAYLPYPLAAIAGSDCIVVAGGDLDADNHLIAANHVREAQWRQGARLLALHPRQGRLAAEADCWFPLRPGDEGTWALGVIHLLLKTKEMVATGDRIKGIAELKEAVKGFTPAVVAKELGCSAELIEEAAHYLAQAKRPAFLCSPPLRCRSDKGIGQPGPAVQRLCRRGRISLCGTPEQHGRRCGDGGLSPRPARISPRCGKRALRHGTVSGGCPGAA